MSNGTAVKKAWKQAGKPGSLKKFARDRGETAWLKSKTKSGRIKRTRKPRITRPKAVAANQGKKKK